ncbi:MAG: hypothetical protein A3F72_19345 [Bacteroidetes bacterium RIFCSPLOWO2_12_FULL_35_15]|nr:MAG: hypothetical protein A3F72_19345 [Bacteroidetes bacterium RIFCSPLOWO2_12_FULL_35_15]
MKKIFLLLHIILLLSSCEKKDANWNLQRSNPADNQGSSNGSAKTPSIKFSKYEVSADNNNDQQINKGESIKLKIYLKNNGGIKANKVRGTVSCSNSNISALSPSTAVSYYTYCSSGYDYIDAGQEGCPGSSGSYLSFNVSNATPNGTIITFNVSITDEANNTWSDSFTITVVGTGASIEFSKYDVSTDNNNDQQINKGESIKLKVYLKNNGSSKANKVRGTISCSNSYISALSPSTAVSYYTYCSSGYDYIDAGQEGCPGSSGSYLSFNVSNTTPNGTIITFNVSITDEANNTWSDSFTITVVGTGASIGFSKYDVSADNNNDQQINKGESIKLKVYLKNNGSSKANKVRGTISCSSSYISALSPTSAVSYYTYCSSGYDYIDSGQEGCPGSSGSYLSFNVSSTTPTNTVITFNVAITDESNNTWSDSFTITVIP